MSASQAAPAPLRSWSADGRSWTLEPHPDSAEFEVVVDDRVELRCSRSALDLLARQALAEVRGRPVNSGKRWSEEADDALRVAFAADGVAVAELARRFGRSRSSIKARLARLGLIEDDGSYRRYVNRPSTPDENGSTDSTDST